MNDLALFGVNVRRLRKAHGWTQRQLAARCEVNPSTISAIEQALNSTGLDIAIRLARIFEVGLDQLTGFAATRAPGRTDVRLVRRAAPAAGDGG